MGKISIRKATARDFEQLKELKKEFFLYEAERDRLINRSWAYTTMPKRLGKDLRSKKVLYVVAEKDRKLIGYAGAEIEKVPSFRILKKRTHLFNLYLKKPYRNRSIGTRLTAEVMRWSRSKGIKQMMVMTYWWNENAKRLYTRLGFKDYIMMMVKPR